MAAVHYLLAQDPAHPLASFYSDLSSQNHFTGNPYPPFRSICLEHAKDITGIISTRRVQTNVIRRNALLLPAFGDAIRRWPGLAITLVEVGCSAGLNLFWDSYRYDYGEGVTWGNLASPARLTTTVKGKRRPPMPSGDVAIADRVGIDLSPVDLRRDDEVAWLNALVWPERMDEAELLQRAIELACGDLPHLLSGNALDLLPQMLDDTPQGSIPIVFQSHTLSQFPADGRARFKDLVYHYGKRRDLALISLESRLSQDNSELDLTTYVDGTQSRRHLAECDSHGYRIRWLSD